MCAESIFTGRANSNFCYNFPKTAFHGIQSYAACRISHALIHVERYLLRRTTEKKKEEKGSKKKIRNWNEWICTENFYPHSKFIYARHFERSESFLFWNFFKKSRNKRNNTNFIIYGSNNLTCNLILLYDYYAPPLEESINFEK